MPPLDCVAIARSARPRCIPSELRYTIPALVFHFAAQALPSLDQRALFADQVCAFQGLVAPFLRYTQLRQVILFPVNYIHNLIVFYLRKNTHYMYLYLIIKTPCFPFVAEPSVNRDP